MIRRGSGPQEFLLFRHLSALPMTSRITAARTIATRDGGANVGAPRSRKARNPTPPRTSPATVNQFPRLLRLGILTTDVWGSLRFNGVRLLRGLVFTLAFLNADGLLDPEAEGRV